MCLNLFPLYMSLIFYILFYLSATAPPSLKGCDKHGKKAVKSKHTNGTYLYTLVFKINTILKFVKHIYLMNGASAKTIMS